MNYQLPRAPSTNGWVNLISSRINYCSWRWRLNQSRWREFMGACCVAVSVCVWTCCVYVSVCVWACCVYVSVCVSRMVTLRLSVSSAKRRKSHRTMIRRKFFKERSFKLLKSSARTNFSFFLFAKLLQIIYTQSRRQLNNGSFGIHMKQHTQEEPEHILVNTIANSSLASSHLGLPDGDRNYQEVSG